MTTYPLYRVSPKSFRRTEVARIIAPSPSCAIDAIRDMMRHGELWFPFAQLSLYPR